MRDETSFGDGAQGGITGAIGSAFKGRLGLVSAVGAAAGPPVGETDDFVGSPSAHSRCVDRRFGLTGCAGTGPGANGQKAVWPPESVQAPGEVVMGRLDLRGKTWEARAVSSALWPGRSSRTRNGGSAARRRWPFMSVAWQSSTGAREWLCGRERTVAAQRSSNYRMDSFPLRSRCREMVPRGLSRTACRESCGDLTMRVVRSE